MDPNATGTFLELFKNLSQSLVLWIFLAIISFLLLSRCFLGNYPAIIFWKGTLLFFHPSKRILIPLHWVSIILYGLLTRSKLRLILFCLGNIDLIRIINLSTIWVKLDRDVFLIPISLIFYFHLEEVQLRNPII